MEFNCSENATFIRLMKHKDLQVLTLSTNKSVICLPMKSEIQMKME